MLNLPIQNLPAVLQREFAKLWTMILEVWQPEDIQWIEEALENRPAMPKELLTACIGSRYLVDRLQRHLSEFRSLVDEGELWQFRSADYYRQQVMEQLDRLENEQALNQYLRSLRHREMVRLIYRDFNRLSNMEQMTQEISHLAEACIELALQWHYRRLCADYGTPIGRQSGLAQQLVVLGMGKLGAYELNLSSDIDLIFTFPEAGDTQGGSRSIENQQFFLKLGQRLVQSLDTINADGFVFRVDMRLRPYGQSGSLALSFDAMEEYYQDQGRDWERYAMIKARVVAGDQQAGERMMKALRPFTYRRYIDFSAIDSLREMKAMIHREVQRRGKENDVKIGAGGIREIEFIAQSFQLIRGGRQPELQQRQVQRVLTYLGENDLLPASVVTELLRAYVFLRNTEHAIQGYQDKQTQALPEDELVQARLAYVMGFGGWDAFFTQLQQHRDQVHGHFEQLISDPEDEQREGVQVDSQWLALWAGEFEQQAGIAQLQQAGFEQAEHSFKKLTQLRESGMLRVIQSIGRTRLNQFMPLLLQALASSKTPSLTLSRALPLVEAVVRRTSYLVLLVENPQAMSQLITLCEASPWIAQQLTHNPVLLDELLNAGTLYSAPDRQMLRQDLYQQMLRIPTDDQESQMEGLRYFKLAHVLRVAASEVMHKLPLMKVSDYLSFIAETVLEHVVAIAWEQLISRYGRPAGADGNPCELNFIIVAYGKLGGIELGYSSDLDLVFIHNAPINGVTDGDKSIDNGLFYTRLGQRIIHILTVQTTMGQLYEVDMRLRPSGASGLLVTTLRSFADYQGNSAWTWEHQALVRARVVAGCPELKKDFEALRRDILCRPREPADLKHKVVKMRKKMAAHLLPNHIRDQKSGLFHLKHSRGGIVDIEFMVQYAVLVWAQKYPALTRRTDNNRLLQGLLEAGLFTEEEVAQLIEAYKVYRTASHRLALQQQPSEVPFELVKSHQDAVLAKWGQLFGDIGS